MHYYKFGFPFLLLISNITSNQIIFPMPPKELPNGKEAIFPQFLSFLIQRRHSIWLDTIQCMKNTAYKPASIELVQAKGKKLDRLTQNLLLRVEYMTWCRWATRCGKYQSLTSALYSHQFYFFEIVRALHP